MINMGKKKMLKVIKFTGYTLYTFNGALTQGRNVKGRFISKVKCQALFDQYKKAKLLYSKFWQWFINDYGTINGKDFVDMGKFKVHIFKKLSSDKWLITTDIFSGNHFNNLVLDHGNRTARLS